MITNVEAGHLAGVKDVDGVMKAKGELLEALGDDGTAVLNIDDQRICRLAERFGGRVVSFGIQSSAEVWATPVSQSLSGSSFDLCWYDESVRVRLPIPGHGAIYNALAAAAVGYRLGLSMEEVKKGLEAMVPMPGRMEILTLPGGVHLINDSYNANPGSMALAIDTLGSLKGNGRGILIVGDMLELGEHAESAHRELGILVTRAGTARLYATGEFARVVAEGATGAGMDPGRIFIGSHDEIIAEALFGSTAFSCLLDLPSASPVSFSPAVVVALSEDCRTQARIGVESKTGIIENEKQKYKSDEAISLFFTVRQYPSSTEKFDALASFQHQCRLAEELMAEKIIPNFVQPLTSVIAQKRIK